MVCGPTVGTQVSAHPRPNRLSRRPFPHLTLQDEVDSLRKEKIDLQAQLFEAAEIQRKLSGPRELRHGCLEFAREVFAASFLSGDFTNLCKITPKFSQRTGTLPAKASQQECGSRTWQDSCSLTVIRIRSRQKIAYEINRHLCYLRPVAPFVTAFFARIDCHLGDLTYCNAGHCPPILASRGWANRAA